MDMKKIYAALRLALLSAVLVALLSACGSPQQQSAPEKTDLPDIQYTLNEELPVPEFSAGSGTYSEPFSLEIGGCKDYVIRYTLDGSVPGASSQEYTGPIELKNRSDEPDTLSATEASLFAPGSEFKHKKVNKCTVVRAACFDGSGGISRTAAASYFIGLDYDGYKIVSLIAEPDDLFDYEKGIYVLGKAHDDWYKKTPNADETNLWEVPGNYSEKGRDWERPVHADIIGADGKLLHSQELGMRIMGTASRSYYQKSFRFYARKEYGKKNIKCALIDGLARERDGEPLEKFKRFLLRAGGNDNESLMMRDPFIQKLTESCNYSTQGSEPCVVYIDGEYWGLYNITEDYDDDYIEDNYDIDKKNVIMVKVGQLEEGEKEDMNLFSGLMRQVTASDFTKPEDYEWICSAIDIDGFIDCAIVNLYTDNDDGMFGDYGENNWTVWRCRDAVEDNEYGDCRWRFMLCGTEFSLGLYGDGTTCDEDTLGNLLQRNKTGFTGLFIRLLENDDFRERFIRRFMELRNEVFAPDNSLAVLDGMASRYGPLVEEQIYRNGPEWALYYGSAQNFFNANLDVVKTYLKGRYKYTPEMLCSSFEGERGLIMSLAGGD